MITGRPRATTAAVRDSGSPRSMNKKSGQAPSTSFGTSPNWVRMLSTEKTRSTGGSATKARVQYQRSGRCRPAMKVAGGEDAPSVSRKSLHGNGSSAAEVRKWVDKTRHPTTDRLFTEMVFQPMLELL